VLSSEAALLLPAHSAARAYQLLIGLFSSPSAEEALVRRILSNVGGVALFGRVQIVGRPLVRRVAVDLMMVPGAPLAAVGNRRLWHVLAHNDAPLRSAFPNLR
jgi:hypothetical protein